MKFQRCYVTCGRSYQPKKKKSIIIQQNYITIFSDTIITSFIHNNQKNKQKKFVFFPQTQIEMNSKKIKIDKSPKRFRNMGKPIYAVEIDKNDSNSWPYKRLNKIYDTFEEALERVKRYTKKWKNKQVSENPTLNVNGMLNDNKIVWNDHKSISIAKYTEGEDFDYNHYLRIKVNGKIILNISIEKHDFQKNVKKYAEEYIKDEIIYTKNMKKKTIIPKLFDNDIYKMATNKDETIIIELICVTTLEL